MTDKSTDAKTKTETSPADTAGGRGGSRPGRGGKGGRGNRNPVRAKPAQTKIAVSTFAGTCKKELAGKVIVYSESRATMAAQWIKFESAVRIAAGKVDGDLARAIANKKPLTLADFLSTDHDYLSEYTDQNPDGSDRIDEKKKSPVR